MHADDDTVFSSYKSEFVNKRQVAKALFLHRCVHFYLLCFFSLNSLYFTVGECISAGHAFLALIPLVL